MYASNEIWMTSRPIGLEKFWLGHCRSLTIYNRKLCLLFKNKTLGRSRDIYGN